MWMIKRIKVALYERALVYRDSDLERETLEKVTEKVEKITVYNGLEGVLKNMVPGLMQT